MDLLKIPPHSIDAEQAVLGGLMLDNESWDKVVDRMAEADFYQQNHRVIFQAIGLLYARRQSCDVLTVSEVLKSQEKLEEAGGEVYLFELANNTPSAVNISAYADIVREKSILRQLISVSNEIADTVFHAGDKESKQILDEAERKIFEIAEQKSRGQETKHIQPVLQRASERIQVLSQSESTITGLSTGFKDFDSMTCGLQPGDLIIIAGRPSMGKTAFAMNIVEYALLKHKQPVLMFSMEMSSESLALRLLASLGRIDLHRIRTGQLKDEDWPRLTHAIDLLSESPLYIDDTPALSPAELRSRARRVFRKAKGLSLIVIDYLQLMQVPGTRENRTTELGEISRSLKALAKELSVPIVILSQLNRNVEQRVDKRPVLSDLRESGALEQDADVIAFIYRDEVYHEESLQKGMAELIIGKQRNGSIGKVRLAYLGKYTRFENL